MSTNNFRGNDTSPTADHENFAKYFEHFLQQQCQDLQSLRSAASSSSSSQTHQEPESEDSRLRPLIDRVLSHYESYYRTKSLSAHHDVLPMFTPAWTSSTENLFLWVAGWRPSLAIHLLYSKSGLQLDPSLARILDGLPTRDLSDLTHNQLARIDQLQRNIRRGGGGSGDVGE